MADAKPGVHSEDALLAILTSPSAEAISEYLTLVEDTESPRVFHTWALLGAVAAILGKNAELISGSLVVRPNMYVILIGPPALKKSTAINMMQDMIRGTSVYFGPTDTAGQRHGIMSALTGLHRFDGRERTLSRKAIITQALMRPRSSRDMALFVPELGSLWGTSNREMADFLLRMYDSEDIDYETKSSVTLVKEPLVNLLGATTPSSLASMLPENAASHGILSRLIFVYADTIHKLVPLPPEPTDDWFELRERIISRLRWIDGSRRNFWLAPEARAAYESLYSYHPKLDDPRLESYRGRRANILLRVSMAICALRCDTWIIESDIRLAHELMKDIEPSMHKALESFGRNKAYQGRMVIIQFLKKQPSQTAGMQDVLAAAASEMTRREAEEVLSSMAANKEITVYGNRVILGSASRTTTEH